VRLLFFRVGITGLKLKLLQTASRLRAIRLVPVSTLRHIRHGSVLLLSALICHPAAASDPRPLVFGVFPNLTARQIVATYRPVADALQKSLRRPVQIYTAPDFKTFVERTHAGEYDLVLTAPHFAWLARQDAGYRPLLKYTLEARGLLVVKAGTAHTDTRTLRNRTIAIADPLAISVMAVQAELATEGLQGGIDFTVLPAGTHANAALQVINGRADAAALGMHAYLLLSPDLRRQLHILYETPPFSSLMYLTHPRLRDAEASTTRNALLRFAASPAGKAFMQQGGYGGFVEVDSREIQSFRPYALQAQEILRGTP
jgi:phosphonate transport system substrate-binding protein